MDHFCNFMIWCLNTCTLEQAVTAAILFFLCLNCSNKLLKYSKSTFPSSPHLIISTVAMVSSQVSGCCGAPFGSQKQRALTFHPIGSIHYPVFYIIHYPLRYSHAQYPLQLIYSTCHSAAAKNQYIIAICIEHVS